MKICQFHNHSSSMLNIYRGTVMANWVAQGGGRSRVLGHYPSTSFEESFPSFFFFHEGIPKPPHVKTKTK